MGTLGLHTLAVLQPDRREAVPREPASDRTLKVPYLIQLQHPFFCLRPVPANSWSQSLQAANASVLVMGILECQ